MRLAQQKRKNGRVYLSVVHGYRDENGKNKTKYIRGIGYLDKLQEQYDDPIAHFTAEVEAEDLARKEKTKPIEVAFYPNQKIDKNTCHTLELGAAVPSAYFHRILGIGNFFEKKRTARNFTYDPCRILELLVWDRIAHPSSKKAAWEARESFPRACKFSLDDVYRSLDYLNENADRLIKSMNESLEKIAGPRNKTRLYYDVTNYYFEVENEDELRRRGVSKEHRPNPIVQMGLLLDGDGIPLDYEIFAGNQNDMTTMLPVMKKAHVGASKDDCERERVIMVADKGLNTSNNIAACTLDGNGFILSQSVRKATKTLKEWVLDEADYVENESGNFKIKSRISDKNVRIKGEDGKMHTVKVPVKEVAFWSRDFFEKNRHDRACVIEKSKKAIASSEMASASAKTSIRYAVDKPIVKETGEKAQHNWVLDEAKIAADEAMDGYYCIVTSEQEMPDREIINAYRGLWQIEDSFRVLKSDFDARPVYVSREEHIRAHFLICYIALLIMRLIQADTGRKYSAADVSEALRGCTGHLLDQNIYFFDYRTDLTDELATVAGIDLSKTILTKAEIRTIMSDVKKQ